MISVEFSNEELDELSQFLFWIEDRRVEGPPWWPAEPAEIQLATGPLGAAVGKLHTAWVRMRGLS